MVDKAAKQPPELVPIHIRIPRRLFVRLLKKRDAMQATDPMANLSDAARAALEDGLR